MGSSSVLLASVSREVRVVEDVLVGVGGAEGSMTILRRVGWRAYWDMVGLRGGDVLGSLGSWAPCEGDELAGLLFVGI